MVAAGAAGAVELRRRDRVGALHLRHVRAPAELERDLAAFLGTEAALTFVSCWNANAALLDALCDERTGVFSDRLNHASIIDGMRLARPGAQGRLRARRRRRPAARARRGAARPSRELIVTDGVFSMEGDLAPMPS